MSKFYFTQTKLSMFGRKGKIEPDADGYYELVVGGLNTDNNMGSWHYTADGVRELFAPGSILMRRVQNGVLRAEVNHPKQRSGESLEQFAMRYMDTDMNNVCAHFKSIWLDEDFGKKFPQYKNPNLIGIMALVKPIPPKGDILAEALKNTAQNVCFSIRALCDEGFVRGKVIRVLKDLIALDLVNEGGLTMASKWDSPATESIAFTDPVLLTEKLIQRAKASASKTSNEHVAATESSLVALDYIEKKYFAPPASPIYTKW